MVLINFILSCDLFWGYSMMLDPNWFTSIQSIISCVETSLQSLLKKNGFDVLYEKSKLLNFLIHDHTYQSLCALNVESTVYICDHNT